MEDEQEKEDIDSDAKPTNRKITVCAILRPHPRCQSRWVGERLNMGTEAGVSRGLRLLLEPRATPGL